MDNQEEMFIQFRDGLPSSTALIVNKPSKKTRTINNLALKLAHSKTDPPHADIFYNTTPKTEIESEKCLLQRRYKQNEDIDTSLINKSAEEIVGNSLSTEPTVGDNSFSVEPKVGDNSFSTELKVGDKSFSTEPIVDVNMRTESVVGDANISTESVVGENNLSTIIKEIYERSLQRDKKLDHKIKTLAHVVTRTVIESKFGNSVDPNCDQNTKYPETDIDNPIDTSYSPNFVDDKISPGIDDFSSDNTNQSDRFSINIKVEPVIDEESEQSMIDSESNVNDSFSVPEELEIDEEKYEYFSRNVKLFVNRDVPLIKGKAPQEANINTDPTENQIETDLPTSNSSPKVLGKKVQANIRKFGSEKPFECDICNRTFSQNGHLNRHMRIHTGDKPFQCDICGKEFSQSGDKRRHERTHSSFRPYQCFICDKEFNQSGHLQRHLRVHAGHILYNNGEFDKELTRKKYTEEKEAAKDKTKKCPLCDKIFIKKYLLDRHVRSHTGETPYKCEECGKGFTRKDRLQTHARIHTGEKPYCCQQCGKGFNQSSHLKTHIRIHTGDRPYKCGICGKGFAQSHDRKKHVRVHTGERPYICHLCGKDFNDNSQLWRHARTHDDFDKSEGTSFKCRLCDNEYEYSSQLLQHMKDHTTDLGNMISVPNVHSFQNDSEMEAVRLTAEALVKNTMVSPGKMDTKSPVESVVSVYGGQELDSDSMESAKAVKVEQLSDDATSGSDASMETEWDGQMYIAENI